MIRPITACLNLSVLLTSCSITDPSEDIPSYISVDTIRVKTGSTEGTASHKVTDAWLFVNENLIGTYEVPFTVPVITNGNATVRIRGGIKLNGIASTRVIYPFFDFYDTSFVINPLDTALLSPVFRYFPNTDFPYQETFEVTNTFVPLPGSDTTMMTRQDQEAFEGLRYGAILVDQQRKNFIVRTKTGSPLKLTGSKDLFLELNYKCNIPFWIYFVGDFPTGSIENLVVGINPSEKWNKIYVNFTPYARDNPGASDYYVVFSGSIGTGTGYVYFDNLKLVTVE